MQTRTGVYADETPQYHSVNPFWLSSDVILQLTLFVDPEYIRIHILGGNHSDSQFSSIGTVNDPPRWGTWFQSPLGHGTDGFTPFSHRIVRF